MRYSYVLSSLLFTLASSKQIISPKIINHSFPACRNCVHYKATSYNNFDDKFNRCTYFGKKDVVSDKIEYDFADSCRDKQDKCGVEGKYFEEEENLDLKIVKHSFIKNIAINILILYVIIVAFVRITF